MLISFDVQAVEKWADFSGDYNPIHFDPAAAANVSDEGLLVHGMLVLLPVKQIMTEQRDDLALVTRQWTRLQTSFRQAVPQSRTVGFRVTMAERKARYAVLREDSQSVYCQGTMSDGMPPEATLPGGGTVFDHRDLLRRWECFRDSFPYITSNWIFVDALLFSEFVQRNASDLIAAVTGGRTGIQHTEKNSRFVVQTSQSVWFDQAYLKSLALPGNLDLTYRHARGEWMADGDRVIGRVGLEARINDRRVLHSDVGLLLQGLPAVAGGRGPHRSTQCHELESY